MPTNLDYFASTTEVRHTLAIVVGVVVTSIIFSGSKNGQQLFNVIYHAVNHLFGGAPHTVDMPGPTGFPVVGNLYQMKDGHVQILSEWIKKYGPVMRVALGERESVFINSHSSMAQTIVSQGPAFQSRPTFKLFHNDFASSGIWTVGTSPYSDRLARTRKALSAQIAPRILPIYAPLIQPQLRRLMGVVSNVSKGPALDLAEILHCFGTGSARIEYFGSYHYH